MNHMSDVLEETISKLKQANQELQKDIEEKIQIDDMRKEFLGNVSHELKTPLALIQGYAGGLQDCINDDPGRAGNFNNCFMMRRICRQRSEASVRYYMSRWINAHRRSYS